MEVRGDGCVERAEFERHAAFVKETSGDFREALEQDESDGVWCHWVLFDTRYQISCDN